MSDLRVNTISASNGTGPVTLTKQIAAKSWASFDQTSTDHPVYDSFNVSATFDAGGGSTKITFSNNMSNANYSTSGAAQPDGFNGCTFGLSGKRTDQSKQMTTSDFRTNNRNSSGSDTDTQYVAFVVHGDLA